MERLTRQTMNRRSSLKLMGAGAVSLVGTSLLPRLDCAQAPFAPGTSHVNITTHEHYGDMTEQLVFPDTWELDVLHMKGHGQAEQLILFSQYMQKRAINQLSSKGLHLARTRNDVLALLQKQHRTEARVAVYPYVGIQYPDVDIA